MADYLKIGVDIPDIDKQIAEAKAFKEELVKTAAVARGDLAPALDSAAAHAKKLSDEFAKTKEEAGKIFAKGLSESLPEQLQDVAKGFEIAGDKNQSFVARLQGGAGAALIAKTAMIDLGARVMEFGRAIDEANSRTEAQARRLRELGATTREIRTLNGDAVQSTDAYALRVQLLGDGLQATAREQAQLIELARRHKLAGEDNAAAITRVTAAINGDVAAQRLLGMSTAQGATAQERMREALALSTQEHRRRGPVEEDAIERARRNAQQQQSGSDAILRAVGAYTGLTGTYDILTRSAHGYSLLLQRIEQGLSGTTTATRGAGRETANLNTESGKLTSTTGRTKDQIQALNEQLNRQRDAANAAATAQKSLAESLREVNLEARAGETASQTVERNVSAVNRALVGRDQQRHTQRAVFRRMVAGGARASAVREVLGMAAVDPMVAIQREMARQVRRKQVENVEYNNMISGAGGARYLDPRGGGFGSVDSLDATSSELSRMRSEEETKRREQITFEMDQVNTGNEAQRLGDEGKAAAEIEQRTGERDRNVALATRNDFGGQIGSAFTNTQTMAERTADSVKSSFDTMTQGLSGFMDTLIESPEKAGEASVALAKGVLKGIAMMALQKSLFSTAEGIVALTNPVTAPTAAGFFAAAGIYAGVAVAAGAGAAGIAASQRGSAQATPPSNNSGFGPARADSGRSGGQRGGDTYVISVNGSILDTGGFEEAVGRAVRGARGRGA